MSGCFAIAGILILAAFPAAADSALVRKPVEDLAYLAYHAEVRSIVARNGSKEQLTMDSVEKWTRAASRIRYEQTGDYTWKSPEQVEADGSGDCNDKALWLFAKLRAAGARQIEVVLGKRELAAATYHAWVRLAMAGKTYILDPTESGVVWESGEFGPAEYVPCYSFDGSRTYAYEPTRR